MTKQTRRTRIRAAAAAVGVTLVAALAVGGCDGGDGSESASGSSEPTPIPQPTQAEFAAAGIDGLPVAPQGRRLDLTLPTFSNPTQVTNPLFPISELRSAILSGTVEGKPFHTETTLLPQTRVFEWEGRQFRTLVSQYFAYLDGRIEEVALDYYAQADDGSVWYFGEDVFDYNEAGLVDSNLGSWLAGTDGPPAMIMPGDPRVGDVFRAENIPSVAFEEVTVDTVGKSVDGPLGPVPGAMVGRELHDDGTYSDKVFAPGYGEFFSAHEGDVEAMALALPTDAAGGPLPPELKALSAAAGDVFDASRSGDWSAAASAERAVARSWNEYRRGQLPPRLALEMDRAIDALGAAVDAHRRTAAGTAAIDVGQSALDFELRHRPQAEIDRARFELWADQVLVDAAAGDLGGVRGDVATLEWILDRFAPALDRADRTRINAHLVALRESVSFGVEELAAASEEAAQLRSLAALRSR